MEDPRNMPTAADYAREAAESLEQRLRRLNANPAKYTSDLEPVLIHIEQTDKGITEVIYGDNSEDSEDRTSVSFNTDSIDICGYWNGNAGEWSGQWLGANFDRAAVEHLRDMLNAWLEQTK